MNRVRIFLISFYAVIAAGCAVSNHAPNPLSCTAAFILTGLFGALARRFRAPEAAG